MKQKFWQTKEFKRIEEEWYRRLEEEKFRDIEKTINGEGVLKQRASNCYRGVDQLQRENKQRYFELLGHNLHKEAEFKDEVEEFIMEKRAHGLSINAICRKLAHAGERCHRETVSKTIQTYETKWRIKKK